jgi:hypothetical protein
MRPGESQCDALKLAHPASSAFISAAAIEVNVNALNGAGVVCVTGIPCLYGRRQTSSPLTNNSTPPQSL